MKICFGDEGRRERCAEGGKERGGQLHYSLGSANLLLLMNVSTGAHTHTHFQSAIEFGGFRSTRSSPPQKAPLFGLLSLPRAMLSLAFCLCPEATHSDIAGHHLSTLGLWPPPRLNRASLMKQKAKRATTPVLKKMDSNFIFGSEK